MAQDIKCQLVDIVKKGEKVHFTVRRNHRSSNSAQLLVFVRYSFDRKLNEDILFCSLLKGTCTGEDIFTKFDDKVKGEGLSWDECISVCTDGAGAMLGVKKGLTGGASRKFTHCIIQRRSSEQNT